MAAAIRGEYAGASAQGGAFASLAELHILCTDPRNAVADVATDTTFVDPRLKKVRQHG